MAFLSVIITYAVDKQNSTGEDSAGGGRNCVECGIAAQCGLMSSFLMETGASL